MAALESSAKSPTEHELLGRNLSGAYLTTDATTFARIWLAERLKQELKA